MQKPIRISNFFPYLLIFCCFQLIGCSVTKKLARKLGMRKKTVKIKDLGSDYKKYKNTRFDFFNPSKKIRKKTKRKAIIISYNHFKTKGVDDFLKAGNLIFAQYKFADATLDRFHLLLKEAFGPGFLRMSSGELARALKKRDSGKIKMVSRIKQAYYAMKLALKSSKDMVNKAQTLISEGKQVVKKTVSTLKRRPERSILAPFVLKEGKRVTSRLFAVVKGTPKLVKKFSKTRKIITILPKLF